MTRLIILLTLSGGNAFFWRAVVGPFLSLLWRGAQLVTALHVLMAFVFVLTFMGFALFQFASDRLEEADEA
jgi:hypothetical protein